MAKPFSLFAAVLVLTAWSSAARAQRATWCLQWNDGCSTCWRATLGGDITCTEAKSGRTTRPVRCERADRDELRQRCKKWQLADSCNVCTPRPDGTRMCTLRGCPPGEMWIVCMRPKR